MAQNRMTLKNGSDVMEGDAWHNLLGYEAEYIADTVAHNGNFISIQVIEDATFSTLTSNWTGNTVASLPIGIYNGQFTAIKLSAGKIVAYKGEVG